MSDYIVNESKFVIDISDDLKDEALAPGTVLPNLVTVGDQLDRSDNFQIYDSKDGAMNILVVKRSLALRWQQEGFLPKNVFYEFLSVEGEEISLVFSPSGVILQRVSSLRAYGSLRYALSFAAAMFHSRSINPQTDLRNGIFMEYYGVILPCYTKARGVADRALFLNVLSKDHTEDLSSKEELGINHGLNRAFMITALKNAGFKIPAVDPYLDIGERVDDFVPEGEGLLVSSYVVLDRNYQVYATGNSKLILLMENSWADELVSRGLISRIDQGSLSFGGIYLKALSFSTAFALEKTNDRHFGLSFEKVFKFALAVRRTRQLCPDADLSDALYSEELGLLLPVSFGADGSGDESLVREAVTEGPFANAPFLEDVIEAAVSVVRI